MTTQSLKTCPETCSAAPAALRSGRSDRGFVSSFVTAVDTTLELMVDALFTWQQRSVERARLQSLDDHMLRDIGLSRADIEAEADKPFWKP